MLFSLFASCLPVEGASKSLIVDLGRNESYNINNNHLNALKDIKALGKEGFKKKSGISSKEIDQFIKKIVDEELGFMTETPESFPEIDLTWKSPYKISNAIIQINKNSTYNLKDCIKQLENLGCHNFQIRIEDYLKIEKLKKIISFFENSRVKFIELLIPFQYNLNIEIIESLIEEYPRLKYIKIYGAISNKILDIKKDINSSILFYEKDIRVDTSEIISPEYFFYNLDVFTEAQKHNLGLNRKVSITDKGDIKNYITHEKSHGNIKKNKLKDIIEKDNFKKLWFLSNDKIEKCKNCQYRYSCISNSDIEKIEGLYFKKNTCNFNPYTNKWDHKK